MSVSYSRLCAALCAATALLSIPQAFAHVSLAVRQSPVDSRYQAVLRVPHGCNGSATTRITVQVPEGLIEVKPQPKAGWALTTERGDYAAPHTLRGKDVTSGVRQISWQGGPLQDDHYDEFVFVGFLSQNLQPGTTLHFPVVQECDQGNAQWTDTSGQHHHGAEGHGAGPAPALKLLPKPQ